MSHPPGEPPQPGAPPPDDSPPPEPSTGPPSEPGPQQPSGPSAARPPGPQPESPPPPPGEPYVQPGRAHPPPPSYPQVPAGEYGQAYPPAGGAGTNVMAILSLVFAFVFAPIGIVLGHVAKRQIRETGEQGDGLATAGLVLSYIFTGLAVLACCGALVLGGVGALVGTNPG